MWSVFLQASSVGQGRHSQEVGAALLCVGESDEDLVADEWDRYGPTSEPYRSICPTPS